MPSLMVIVIVIIIVYFYEYVFFLEGLLRSKIFLYNFLNITARFTSSKHSQTLTSKQAYCVYKNAGSLQLIKAHQIQHDQMELIVSYCHEVGTPNIHLRQQSFIVFSAKNINIVRSSMFCQETIITYKLKLRNLYVFLGQIQQRVPLKTRTFNDRQ